MKIRKQRKYEIRGMRIYNIKTYDDFRSICMKENTSVSRVLNGVINDIVNKGTTDLVGSHHVG